ncbi:hypothetical protein [Endozoicomonas atrinae]|uniref:ApeI family dehydratase n=1 Tax=Endozoicomonas atrinae TaxID=1333660 RepID=UPI000824368E|nr:hypothetical protein [Endozoicomonas atrinae]
MSEMLEPLVETVEKSGQSVQLTLFVPEELSYFRGHFPGHPVLPGVVQTHWAIGYGAQYLGLPQRIKRLEVIKFQNLIQPKTRLTLKLELNSKGKLVFSYDQQGRVMSSGRIVYPEDS